MLRNTHTKKVVFSGVIRKRLFKNFCLFLKQSFLLSPFFVNIHDLKPQKNHSKPGFQNTDATMDNSIEIFRQVSSNRGKETFRTHTYVHN